jgi:hypothetical protein
MNTGHQKNTKLFNSCQAQLQANSIWLKRADVHTRVCPIFLSLIQMLGKKACIHFIISFILS